MSISVVTTQITSSPRKIAAGWSVEQAQDMQAFHGYAWGPAEILRGMAFGQYFKVQHITTRLSRSLHEGQVMWVGPAKFTNWNDEHDFSYHEIARAVPVIYIDTVQVKVFDKNATSPSITAVLYRCLFRGRLIAIPGRLRFLC